jgi:hypothetical protein
MEAAHSAEMLINILETTWHYILEDMKFLILSHDSFIIHSIQGIRVACSIPVAFNWI